MNQQEPPNNTTLTLAQARAVRWNRPHHERTIGDLLDEGILSHNDIVWGAEKAYRSDLRAACQVILAAHKRPPAAATRTTRTDTNPSAPSAARPPAPFPTIDKKPVTTQSAHPPAAPPRYGPRVIQASDYLSEKKEEHFGLTMYGSGMGVMMIIYGIASAISALAKGQPIDWVSIIGFLAGLCIVGWYIYQNGRRWRIVHLGLEGEQRIVDLLRNALDSRWTIYRNLKLPNRVADLDLVLVGPGGVWAVQVKAFRPAVRYAGGQWQYRASRAWRTIDPRQNPAKVAGQAAQLSQFLAKHGIQRWVETAIALAEPVPERDVQDSAIPVWLPYTIEQRARALRTRAEPGDQELAQINQLLETRAAEQRAIEDDRIRRGKPLDDKKGA